MPMRLDDGWNQIQFNLSDFTRRAYGVLQPSASSHAQLHRPARVLASTGLKASICRNELHRDLEGSDPRQLPHQAYLFL